MLEVLLFQGNVRAPPASWLFNSQALQPFALLRQNSALQLHYLKGQHRLRIIPAFPGQQKLEFWGANGVHAVSIRALGTGDVVGSP